MSTTRVVSVLTGPTWPLRTWTVRLSKSRSSIRDRQSSLRRARSGEEADHRVYETGAGVVADVVQEFLISRPVR